MAWRRLPNAVITGKALYHLLSAAQSITIAQNNSNLVCGISFNIFRIFSYILHIVVFITYFMIEYSYTLMLDELDVTILRILQENGRISNADLAAQINLSPPASHARVRRLTDQGYITRYVALLDKEKLGYDMVCFISVSLQLHRVEGLEEFRTCVRDFPEVLECHHVTGEFDFLLKVVVRNRKDLERFVIQELTPVPGVARINTCLVLSEFKSTTALPLQKDEDS